jgi:preprotein translocase subunit SecE
MQETTNSKIITLAFVAFGALAAITVQVLFESLAVSFGPVARLHNSEALRHGLPLVVAIITFAILQFTPKIHLWADESVGEVRKVVWPSRRDTIAMTMVCCIMVVLAGIALGAYDFLATHMIKTFVNLNLFH